MQPVITKPGQCSQFNMIYRNRLREFMQSPPQITLLAAVFSPFILHTIFLRGASQGLNYLFLISVCIGLAFFPQTIVLNYNTKYRHMLKLTGMNSSSYFKANLMADMTLVSAVSLGVFILASIFNLSLIDHMIILIGNLVFFFEMISLSYLIAILSKG